MRVAIALALLVPLLAGCSEPTPHWSDAFDGSCAGSHLHWHQPELAAWAADAHPPGWTRQLEPSRDGGVAIAGQSWLAFGDLTVHSVTWMDPLRAERWNPPRTEGNGPVVSFDADRTVVHATFRAADAQAQAREDFALMLQEVLGMAAADAAQAAEGVELGSEFIHNGEHRRSARLELPPSAPTRSLLVRADLGPGDAAAWDGVGNRDTEAPWRVTYAVDVLQFTRTTSDGVHMLRVAADGTAEFHEAGPRVKEHLEQRARVVFSGMGAPALPGNAARASTWGLGC